MMDFLSSAAQPVPAIVSRVTFATLAALGAATTASLPMQASALPTGAVFVGVATTITVPFNNPGHDILDLEVRSSAVVEYGNQVDAGSGTVAGTTIAPLPGSGFGGSVAGKVPTLFFDFNGTALSTLTVGDLTVTYLYMVPP